jgi:hypothetical protein
MAATVLSPVTSRLDRGVYKVVVTIPTTIDGASGAIADFTLSRVFAIGVQSQSTNYNGQTVVLRASNDGVDYFGLPTNVASGSNALLSVASADCAFANYRITIAGAPLATITVTIIGSVHT